MHPKKVYVLYNLLYFGALGFFSTNYAPFLLSVGLTLSDIAIINASYWATVALSELPTGLMADTRSRSWSVKIGSLIFVLGAALYASTTGFKLALMSEIVIGVGSAFLSGAHQAWVTDALQKRGEMGELRNVFGTAASARAVGLLFGGLAGGLVGIFGLRIGFVCAVVGFLVTFVFVLIWMDDSGEPEERMDERQALQASISILRGTPSLIWALVAVSMFGLVLPFNHYWAPYFKEYVGQGGIGILWVFLYGPMVIAGMVVRTNLVGRMGSCAGVCGALLVTGMGLATIGFHPVFIMSVPAAMVHEFGRGLFVPFHDVFVQQRIGSSYRATFGSLSSLVGKVGYVLIAGVVWFFLHDQLTDRSVIELVWMMCGALLVSCTLILWVFRPREKGG